MKSKRTSLVLIGLLIIISSACQKEDAPSCNYPENAKLKRVVICQYVESECPARECNDIIIIEEEYEYDKKGRITRVLKFPKYEDGEFIRTGEYHLYEYNSKGQLVKIESYSSYRDGYWHDKNHIYTCSDGGKMIKEDIEITEVGSQYKLYKYSNNRLTRIECYKLNSDELEFYILYEYDDLGNLIKETAFDKDGGPYNYYQRNVFEDGVIIPSVYKIWGYTKLGSEFLKTYDENNNLILVETTYGAGSSQMNKKLKYEYYD